MKGKKPQQNNLFKSSSASVLFPQMPEDTIPTDKVDIDLTSFKITFLTNNHFWEKKRKKNKGQSTYKGHEICVICSKKANNINIV